MTLVVCGVRVTGGGKEDKHPEKRAKAAYKVGGRAGCIREQQHG